MTEGHTDLFLKCVSAVGIFERDDRSSQDTDCGSPGPPQSVAWRSRTSRSLARAPRVLSLSPSPHGDRR